MTWDPVWEQIFESSDWGRYPPEELIRFVARNFYSARDRKAVHMLELGCGAGANIWFMAREGFQVHGIDGSQTAIAKARKRLQEEGLSADLRVGDAASVGDIFGSQLFDCIVDVGCLQCNRRSGIARILDQSYELLKPGGKLFSIAVAAGSWGDGDGVEVEARTFMDITDGPLADRGLNYFATEEDVRELFRNFDDLRLEFSARSFEGQQRVYKNWVIEAAKVV